MTDEDIEQLSGCRYVAFKLKTDIFVSSESTTIDLRTNVGTVTISIAGVEDQGWVTYIVDLESISGYTKTGDAYPELSSLIFDTKDTGAGEFGVAYFVADDSLEDLAALVDTDVIQFHTASGTQTLNQQELEALCQTAE